MRRTPPRWVPGDGVVCLDKEIDASDLTLLAWLRHAGTEETGDASGEFAAFEDMLATVSFRDESPVTTDASANVATALDGVWTTSVTEDELASSPLLYEPDEVNDQNWGDLTFTFDKGHFTYTQRTRRTVMRGRDIHGRRRHRRTEPRQRRALRDAMEHRRRHAHVRAGRRTGDRTHAARP